MAIAPSPPSSPATRTSLHATPSGYGSASSTINNRRNAIVNIVPKRPPKKAIISVSSHWMSFQIPMTRSAGTVNITPAASDSPALAIVWTALFSRIETSLNNERKIIIDMTAAGILAETVIPTLRPKYAFAAVMRMPRTIPTMTTRRVNSLGDSEAGMYGSPNALMTVPSEFTCSIHRLKRQGISTTIIISLP